MKLSESEKSLAAQLRTASRCADLLGYTESVRTLTKALRKILYPAGFPSAMAYMDFLARETPRGSITSKIPQHDQEEPFRTALQWARSLAAGAGRADVAALVEDAESVRYLIDRLTPDRASKVA